MKDIYRNPSNPVFSIPIDEGGIQARKPNSDAYLHLNRTDVSSYAIIGNWKPNAQKSHKYLEDFYRNISSNPSFNLEGKESFGEDNDLQINITSQSGGLLGYSKCNRKIQILPLEVYFITTLFMVAHSNIMIRKSMPN